MQMQLNKFDKDVILSKLFTISKRTASKIISKLQEKKIILKNISESIFGLGQKMNQNLILFLMLLVYQIRLQQIS